MSPSPQGNLGAIAVIAISGKSYDEPYAHAGDRSAHDVDEVLIVDPATRSVDWLGLKDGEYRPIERSGLIDLGAGDLAERIDWPPVE